VVVVAHTWANGPLLAAAGPASDPASRSKPQTSRRVPATAAGRQQLLSDRTSTGPTRAAELAIGTAEPAPAAANAVLKPANRDAHIEACPGNVPSLNRWRGAGFFLLHTNMR